MSFACIWLQQTNRSEEVSRIEAGFRPFAGFKLAVSAYAAAWGTGFLSYCAMPYLIGSVADGMGLGIDQAGRIASAELLIVALMLIPMSFLPEGDETLPEDDVNRGKVPLRPAAVIIVGIVLWHFCDNSIWGFSERIGTRYGRIWPVCVDIASVVACISGITSTSVIPIYSVSILSYITCFTFISSYICGLAGELDHHGRVMAAASGAGNLGIALAPFISGSLIVNRAQK